MRNRILISIALLIVVGVVVFVFIKATPVNNEEANSLNLYKNDEYGFEVSYPKSLTPDNSFTTYYHLSGAWRANADPESGGNLIVSIPVYRIESKTGVFMSYPLYFDAELRIGASSDPKDIENCLKEEPNYQGATSTIEVINGVTFRRFILGSAGMMQYMYGVSYRIIHNNVCFAIEQLKVGSSYRDITTSSNDIPDSVLDSYYNKVGDIVKTFKFLK